MEKMCLFPQIIIYSVVFASQCDIQQVLFQRLHSVLSVIFALLNHSDVLDGITMAREGFQKTKEFEI